VKLPKRAIPAPNRRMGQEGEIARLKLGSGCRAALSRLPSQNSPTLKRVVPGAESEKSGVVLPLNFPKRRHTGAPKAWEKKPKPEPFRLLSGQAPHP